MKFPAKLITIGNSRGVRLPKAVIELAGLGSELEMEVSAGEIRFTNARPSAGSTVQQATNFVERPFNVDDIARQ